MTCASAPRRESTHVRTYLMCPPDHFSVQYAINPWMNPGDPVDLGLARQQWEQLKATYLGLGHKVEIIDPEPGLPDMVFAANGATVIGGKVLGARFKFPERDLESARYREWFQRNGYQVFDPEGVNQGEGDIFHPAPPITPRHPLPPDPRPQ